MGMPGQESGRGSPFGSRPVSDFNLDLESGPKAHFVGRFDAALKGRSSTLGSVLKGCSSFQRGAETPLPRSMRSLSVACLRHRGTAEGGCPHMFRLAPGILVLLAAVVGAGDGALPS